MRTIVAFGVMIAVPAAAHSGEAHDPPGWTFDPWVLLPLLSLLLIYVIGWRRLAARSRGDRSPWLFLSGWAVLALTLVSPLHEGGETSFTLHMVEHELIMLVATLLLAASGAGGILAWGLPKSLRYSLGGRWARVPVALWRGLTHPVTATVIQAVAMIAWHVPALFDRALESQGWHVAQHVSFVATSFLFWWAMLHPRGGRFTLGISALCLFVTSIVGGGLGALMSFAASPWYAGYASLGLSGIGVDPLSDQHLAGLLMWVPGGAFHAAAALILLYRWLGSGETRNAYPVR